MTDTSECQTPDATDQIISGRVEKLMRITVQYQDAVKEVSHPRSSGAMKTGPWNRDLDDRPAGFTAAVLFDNTLAYALRLADPSITSLVTTELHLNFLHDLPVEITELSAWNRPLLNHKDGGTASGLLTDAAGKELVQATGWFVKVPPGPSEAQDQFQRNTQLPLGPETQRPIASLLAATPVTTTHQPPSATRRSDQPTLHFPGNPELANPHGKIHGGALTMMAGLASQHAMPDRSDFRMQSLRVNFVRPGTGAVQSQVSVRHAGRSLRVVDVELHGAHGKPFVIAQASFTRL